MQHPPSVGTSRHDRLGRLVLADGSVFRGTAFGAEGVTSVAEVVFNTAMSGYQESLTDPSYRGQILVETFPLIGNTGVNRVDIESGVVQVSGLVVRELARRMSNYRANDSLDAFLRDHGVVGLAGIDTRALTRRIRVAGAMSGVISDDASVTDRELLAMARGDHGMEGQNLVREVGRDQPSVWERSLGAWAEGASPAAGDGERVRVLAFDCGAKQNILRHLVSRGCEVEVVPHSTPASDVIHRFQRGAIDGVFVSNGPGDPAAVSEMVDTLRSILDHEASIPVFGICLGHQLLALAIGATTFKLPFGHRGTNQPVLECGTGRVAITSQNHGFAVDAASLAAAGGIVTHSHLNDETVAGFELRERPVFGVQFHPEASPGPHDGAVLFDRFVESMRAARRSPPSVSAPS